jgi:endonuclease G
VPERDARGRYRLTDGSFWDPDMDPPVDESRIKWKANEGIRISSILRRLQADFAGRALAQAVLSAAVPTGGEMTFGDAPDGQPKLISSHDGRRMRIVVPVEITLGIAGAGPDGAPAPPLPGPTAPASSEPDYGVYPTGEEALTIKKDYEKRNGFDPKFLDPSDADLHVPLPKPKAGLAAKFTIDGKKTSELRYWNYSVMLHADRKLALFAAGHVDFAQKKKQTGDATWIPDKRAKSGQTGAEFYKKQKEVEATDRTSNPFDQGHLHMQAHATWGSTSDKANVFGADTFHYPNCAPQFHQYNQGRPDKHEPGDKGTKLWRGLEDFISDKFASGQNRRCMVITGPIFDAPKSPIVDGRPHVNLKGKKAPDPKFGGLKIPKMFFKIVCVVRSGKLAASAFVISQEDYIAKIDRLKPGTNESFIEALTQAQATLYRVTIPDLEKVTGLDFQLEGRSIPWFESARGHAGEIAAWADLT